LTKNHKKNRLSLWIERHWFRRWGLSGKTSTHGQVSGQAALQTWILLSHEVMFFLLWIRFENQLIHIFFLKEINIFFWQIFSFIFLTKKHKKNRYSLWIERHWFLRSELSGETWTSTESRLLHTITWSRRQLLSLADNYWVSQTITESRRQLLSLADNYVMPQTIT